MASDRFYRWHVALGSGYGREWLVHRYHVDQRSLCKSKRASMTRVEAFELALQAVKTYPGTRVVVVRGKKLSLQCRHCGGTGRETEQ